MTTDNFPEFPWVYLITGGCATAENYSEKRAEILSLVEIAVKAKITLIQIREKKLSARKVFELAAEAAKITGNSASKLLVNDRADIALAAGAAGVHLTHASLPAKIIRQNFPQNFIVGVSTHSAAEAVKAEKAGADFVTFSPIFPTPSKARYGAPQGLEKLGEVCRRVPNFPVIALGGIDENNYSLVLKHGAAGFAAIRFLNNEENLRRLTLNVKSG